MSRAVLLLFARLHARGIHVAVLAGLVMMPAMVAAGFLTERVPAGWGLPGPVQLRPTFEPVAAAPPS